MLVTSASRQPGVDPIPFPRTPRCVPQIASSSGDGKILFWSLHNELQYPVQGSVGPCQLAPLPSVPLPLPRTRLPRNTPMPHTSGAAFYPLPPPLKYRFTLTPSVKRKGKVVKVLVGGGWDPLCHSLGLGCGWGACFRVE
jgi:hypothetical protein